MSEYLLSDTLRMLASKLDSIQDVLNGSNTAVRAPINPPWNTGYNSVNTTVPVTGSPNTPLILHKLDTLSTQVEELRRNMAILRNQQLTAQQQQPASAVSNPASILPVHPMHGIEVVPKREVVISDDPARSLSVADRLLLNKDAKKALEAEEMGASRDDEYPLGEEDDETESQQYRMNMQVPTNIPMEMDVEVEKAPAVTHTHTKQEEEQEEEEQEEEEQEEQEDDADEENDGPEDDAEEEELTEFEYKGNTFYRDSNNNVFMTDEDGDLVEEPIGSWNPEKNRIVMKKA